MVRGRKVNYCTIRQDTNQLLNHQCLISSVCVSVHVCAHVYLHAMGLELYLMTIDLWKWRAAGSRQNGRKERKKKIWNRGKEERGGLLLLKVNNTARHFNYHQPAQINFYCPLEKDTQSCLS